MRAELKDCYILCIAFEINKVRKIPLEEFYRQGYWITEIFGDKCYLVKKLTLRRGSICFTSQMRFCELTEKGREFIKQYAEKQYKRYKGYLEKKGNQKPWEFYK